MEANPTNLPVPPLLLKVFNFISTGLSRVRFVVWAAAVALLEAFE
jgi:hypothetical protein